MAAATAACGQSANESSRPTGDERIDVVASFYPLAQVVERVGGDRVRVENLTPSGVEPHDLELTPAQVDSIDDADFVVFLGGGFQPAVEKAVKRRGPAATDVSEGVGLVSGAAEALKAEEGGGDQAGEVADGQAAAADPHFWLDPQLLAKTISPVQDALTKAKPADSDEFRANGAAMADELAALDLRFREGLANCVRREVVTAHAAFYYLTARYGLTQRPITGLSPESEPDPGRLAELTDLIKSRGITTVFYEEL
ncbi:MAG: metal ABC transporter substrate-binding protein, partial [Pseudonocardiaceae bacterium]